MKIYEIGTGYTSIPATISAATEIVVEQLTKAMLEQNVDVNIIDICDSNRIKSNLPIIEVKVPKIFVDADVQLGIMHKLKRIIYSLALSQKIRSLLISANEKIILHFHNQYNLFFFLKTTSKRMKNKCLIVYTNHSGIWRLNWDDIKDTIRRKYFQEAECMRKADIVFVLNKETKNNAVSHAGVDIDRIKIIDNGVNTDIYHPINANIDLIKKKYGFSNKKIFLQVGSVYENKGQLETIKCFQPLFKKNENIIYAYAGGIVSEVYQNEISSYIKSHHLEDKVKYLGMIKPGAELNELYNCAEATILYSKYESFGLTIIESMAAGVPVLIESNSPFSMGEGNILFDKDHFCECINKNILNKDKLKIFKNAARENVMKNYSWEKIASDYLSFWEDKNYGK